MTAIETLQEKLGVLRAMLVNTDGDGFSMLHGEDQQAYLAHCAALAAEVAAIVDGLSAKGVRAAACAGELGSTKPGRAPGFLYNVQEE